MPTYLNIMMRGNQNHKPDIEGKALPMYQKVFVQMVSLQGPTEVLEPFPGYQCA